MNTVIPYGKQTIEQDDIQAVVDVLKSDFLTTGPKKTNRTTIRNRGNRSTKAERELNKQIVLNECMKNTSIDDDCVSIKFKNEIAEVTIAWDIYDFDLCCSVLKI